MWEAVFADVGVALLAILNAIRLQKMKWDQLSKAGIFIPTNAINTVMELAYGQEIEPE
jgi:hypothetical protein